jgi:peroxiredoxin
MNIIKSIILSLILIIMTGELISQTEKKVTDAVGLSVGTAAPLFSAIDADSVKFLLNDAIKEGPVVLIFYRGFWCPVCNAHLGSIQDSLKLIEATGAKVIAISPEQPEYLDKMAEKTGSEFTLLYDEGYKIAEAYDVDFNPSKMQLFTYNVILGGKLKDTHSDISQRLPIPATYIVNQQGKIIWRQFDHDYKKRSSVKDILYQLNF